MNKYLLNVYMIIYLFKLLEIFQYVLLSFIISLIVANFLNNTIFPYIVTNKYHIILKVTIYLFILSSIYYLITRYVSRIPFILGFLAKKYGYKPSLKNENIRGTELGVGFIFFSQQNKFKSLVDMLFKYYH